MNKILAFALIAGCCAGMASEASAQQPRRNMYRPGRGARSLPPTAPANELYGTQSLTLSVASFLDGYTALNYERRLNNRLSIAGGLGITFSSFLLQLREVRADERRMAFEFDHGSPAENRVDEEYGNPAYHVPKPGYYLCIAPKYYFSTKPMQGYYVAPLFEYRAYRFGNYRPNPFEFEIPGPFTIHQNEKDILRIREKVRESVRYLDMSAVIGGSLRTRGHAALTYHVGVGMRHASMRRQDIVVQANDNGTFSYIGALEAKHDTRLIANLGVGIGGWW